jgi:perosamine synthetase
MAIAREYGLAVIEDAAPALGATWHDRPVGSFGDAACFSFQGAKMAVCGEGGIFLTDSDDLYERAKLLSSMGRTDSQAVFWSDEIGYQYTMGNMHASLALAQLERADELMAKKRALFDGYYRRLKDVGSVRLVKEREGCRSN